MKARLIGIASATALMLSACGEKDIFNLDKAQQIKEETYAMSFARKFGTVPADQSWDVASGNSFWRACETRADGDVVVDFTKSTDYLPIDPAVHTYMNSQLKEKTNNKSKGKKFTMVVPENEFTLLPIYQGNSGSKFDLYIEVDGTQKKVWSKGEGMQVRSYTYTRETPSEPWGEPEISDWANATTGTCMDATNYYDANNKTIKESEAVKKVVIAGEIQSQKYTFDLSEYKGRLMSFYIHITEGSAGYSTTGDIQSMTDGFMVSLDKCPHPSNLDANTQVLIMGCEVANEKEGHSTDWDMNDIVFLIYGKPYTPMVVEVSNDLVEKVTAKRYMFEDLGSTDDFDFNDVVVDLIDVQKIQLQYENGMKVSETVVSHTQEAIVQHLGGTLPFYFKVGGNTIYQGGSPDTFGTSPKTHLNLEGTPWNPAANNVTLTVEQATNDGKFTTYDVPFPEIGCQAPMAIATDIDVDWQGERVSITPEWFNKIKR